MRLPSPARRLRPPRCEVTTAVQPRSASVSMRARARASPSLGSVPAPGSSMRTRERGPATSSTSCRLRRCAEKVERLSEIDCSSPTSAKKESKTGRRVPGPAGGITPDWASAATSPTDLRKTVLPPVLGPVTTTTPSPSPSSMSKGTASMPAATSSGWRPPRMRSGPSVISGTHPSQRLAARDSATRLSISVSAASESANPPARGRQRSESSRRIRSISLVSALSCSRTRFIISIAEGGSTNTVAPEEDSSWTYPPTVLFPSRRRGITYRPSRMVTDASGTRWRSPTPSRNRSR